LIAFRAARDAGIERFGYASSMAVYGNAEYSPQDEKHPINPTSPYGVSKFASERYILTMGPRWGVEPVAFRFFNTYGPRQTPSPYVGVITIFCRKLFAGESPVIFGDGKQLRDFTHVDDIARGSILGLSKAPAGSVINLGTGIGTSVNEVADILIRQIRPDIKPDHAPPVPGEPGDSIADPALAENLLGWKADRRLADSIDETIEWNRTNPR
jgi:UDP-glucose 4-epimerase